MLEKWIPALWLINAVVAAMVFAQAGSDLQNAAEQHRLRKLIAEATGVHAARGLPLAAQVYGSLLPFWILAQQYEHALGLPVATFVWLLAALVAERWNRIAVVGAGILFYGLGRTPWGAEGQLMVMTSLVVWAIAAQVLSELAETRFSQERTEEALRLLSFAREAAPDSAEPAMVRAAILGVEGRSARLSGRRKPRWSGSRDGARRGRLFAC